MVDGIKKFGNKLTLPSGPLREPINRLEEVDFVVNTNSFLKKEEERKNNEFLMTYKPISWININSKRQIEIHEWPYKKIVHAAVSYTHLTLPTIYSV